MGRDSKFVLTALHDDEERADRQFEQLRSWLASTRYITDEDLRGWGTLRRLSDLVTADQDRAIWAHFASVWLGVGRDIYYPGLLRKMATLPWDDPQTVQCPVKDQDDEVWRLWILRGDSFVEAPQPGTCLVFDEPHSDVSRISLTDPQ